MADARWRAVWPACSDLLRVTQAGYAAAAVPVPALISLAVAVVQALFAALAFGVSRSPGWQALRWFALVALCGAAYALASLAYTVDMSEPTRELCCRLMILLGTLYAIGWYAYFAADENRPLRTGERVMVFAGLALAALAQIPGLIIAGPSVAHHVEWLGVTYKDLTPTPFGMVAYAYYLASLVGLVVRGVKGFAAGRPDSGARLLSLAALFVGALNDCIAGTNLIALPYVLDAAYLVAVGSQSTMLWRRFVAQTAALQLTSSRLALAQAELVKRERLAALGELSAVVAHEVRNPLGVLFNALSRLRRITGPNDEARALLEVMNEEAERLDAMVTDLLDFARPYQARRVPASLPNVVAAALEAVRGAAGEKTRAVQFEVRGELPVTEIDPQLVRQAVVNLVTNAVQVSQGRRPIKVELCPVSSEVVRLEVTDDGPGVAPELRERIFAPFFTTRAKGSGLGLAVVQQVAEAHGGRVSVRPAEQYGSVFSLELGAR